MDSLYVRTHVLSYTRVYGIAYTADTDTGGAMGWGQTGHYWARIARVCMIGPALELGYRTGPAD